jgi:hypothetical protein
MTTLLADSFDRLSPIAENLWHIQRRFSILGVPAVNESVWLHRASRTLILTDSAQWMPGGTDWRKRLFTQLMGVRHALAISRLFKSAIQDRTALRASMQQVLAWDFDRVVLGHDVVIESQGKALLRQAWGLSD